MVNCGELDFEAVAIAIGQDLDVVVKRPHVHMTFQIIVEPVKLEVMSQPRAVFVSVKYPQFVEGLVP